MMDGFKPLVIPGTAPTEGEAPDLQLPQLPPTREALMISDDELARAELTPKCIVAGYLYADLAQTIAPGGTGKTTLQLYEQICIALGRPVWGLDVVTPGWSLLVTAEDSRERLIARMGRIMDAMDLTREERAIVRRSVLPWDVTGEQRPLVFLSDGNLRLTSLADQIVETYQADPPVLIQFDPLVSFGASEQRVNDNEQALVLAARRIINGLGCCVRYTHHTGQNNARAKSLDQYSGRNGSALPDGSRMTTVLQTWEPGDKLTPPAGWQPDNDSSLTVLARPKNSYAPPNLPHIWIKRTGYEYAHMVELPTTPDQERTERAEQLLQFLTYELGQERRYTGRQLDACATRLEMTRSELREALTELEVSGRVLDADLPKDQRQGSRKTFLCPSNCAADYGAVGDE